MAKLVVDNPHIEIRRLPTAVEVAGVGLLAGLAWWPLVFVIERYVSSLAASAGALSLVMVSVFALLALILRRIHRPIFIVVFSGVTLWPFGSFVAGLGWGEVYLWSVLLFTATLSLYGLISKLRSLGIASLVAGLMVIAIRLAVSV